MEQIKYFKKGSGVKFLLPELYMNDEEEIISRKQMIIQELHECIDYYAKNDDLWEYREICVNDPIMRMGILRTRFGVWVLPEKKKEETK